MILSVVEVTDIGQLAVLDIFLAKNEVAITSDYNNTPEGTAVQRRKARERGEKFIILKKKIKKIKKIK